MTTKTGCPPTEPIKGDEITKDYHVYRFESTQKRLEFVEYLLNKIYND